MTLVCAATAGCSAPEADSSGPDVRASGASLHSLTEHTNADVTMREYPHLPIRERSGRVELVQDLVIRERPGQPQYAFGEHPPNIALHDDGRIFVYDPTNYIVKVFAPDGDFLYEFGSRGEGPGEFNRNRRSPVGFVGNRFFLFFNYRQLGFWTPEGEFLERATVIRLDENRLIGLDDGSLVGSDRMIDDVSGVPGRSSTLARFVIGANGLEEEQRYVLLPVWMQPAFTAQRDGTVYATGTNGHLTEVVAFAPDGRVAWITRFRWSNAETIMPSELLLDGSGRLYVAARLNQVERPTTPVDRSVNVLATDGTLLASALIRDLQTGIGWQVARDDFIYGVEENPDTFEWEVVRYRLEIPVDPTAR